MTSNRAVAGFPRPGRRAIRTPWVPWTAASTWQITTPCWPTERGSTRMSSSSVGGEPVLLHRPAAALYGVRRSRQKRAMRTVIRMPLLLLAVAFLIAIGWWWRVDAEFRQIEWTAVNGSLRLFHVPGKNMVGLNVEESYVGGSPRDWLVVKPGAMGRVWGGPSVPPPETLFKQAHIWGRGSSPIGLLGLYDDVTDRQKQEIEAELDDLCHRPGEACGRVREVAREKDLPWLDAITGACASPGQGQGVAYRKPSAIDAVYGTGNPVHRNHKVRNAHRSITSWLQEWAAHLYSSGIIGYCYYRTIHRRCRSRGGPSKRFGRRATSLAATGLNLTSSPRLPALAPLRVKGKVSPTGSPAPSTPSTGPAIPCTAMTKSATLTDQ
jgi:hypothetical protein